MPATRSSPSAEPRRARRPAGARLALLLAGAVPAFSGSCYDESYRWEAESDGPPAPVGSCTPGELRCAGELLERCVAARPAAYALVEDCGATAQSCSAALGRCSTCQPSSVRCRDDTVERCDTTGEAWSPERSCDPAAGAPCRDGACIDLCARAREQRSNVGCEYWAVDLDNANVGISTNAAAQQFALVVSNPQPDVPVRVTVEQDDTLPGTPGAPVEIAAVEIPPLGLRVLKLGPREVDGSSPGEFDTGTHTAHTRAAYRVKSHLPVVAYQFNPLENVNVFSNDASLLKPVEALTMTPGELAPAYVVVGWPQTIASTDNPDTNFNPRAPIDLRAFLTVVGTRPGTRIRIHPSTRVLGSAESGRSGAPGLPAVPAVVAGGVLEATLDPFDVLNLETDDFRGDFTGTFLEADQPVVLFSGSEASDAPFFDKLTERRCCADHLEEQLDPVRTAGKRFVATVSANRSEAVAAAGAPIGTVPQTEYFRVVATTPRGARVTTTLPGAQESFVLDGRGAFADLVSTLDFVLESDEPVVLASVSPSQDDAAVPRGLPGGDPSLLVIPPVEQFRATYVFLTPDKYAFDFVRIVAPPGATIVLDGRYLDTRPGCTTWPGDGLTAAERGSPVPPFVVHRCQLGFPEIDPTEVAPANLAPGVQNDGVHRLEADGPVGLLVDGFDSYVSYAYAGGTELTEIAPPE
ncbi:MAG: IgGFc-binding protein [Polyangiaceae bacterium]|nr:IgGFc-binding protein [Polyangiaceae bacterium]